jgi:hypothetical protein
MNGRIYDATLARFMSADPHIQEGALTQSYNRYSYVMNNPLKYTYPSGYFLSGLIRSVKKHIKRVGRTFDQARRELLKPVKKALKKIAENKVLSAIASIAACTFGGSLGCAAFSAASTYAVTGSLSAAFKAGAIALATAKASSYVKVNFDPGIARAAAHGVVGGTTSVIQGGKFGQGFGSSFFTKMVSGNIQGFAEGVVDGSGAISRMIGAAGAAVVGGTASVLGGGKFSNGAQTAAIQYLFNQVLSSKESNSVVDDINREADQKLKAYDPNRYDFDDHRYLKLLSVSRSLDRIKQFAALEEGNNIGTEYIEGAYVPRPSKVSSLLKVFSNGVDGLERESTSYTSSINCNLSGGSCTLRIFNLNNNETLLSRKFSGN